MGKYRTATKRVLRKINSTKASAAKLEAIEISADHKIDLPENAPKSSLPKPPTLWVPKEIQSQEAFVKIQSDLDQATRAYHIACTTGALKAKQIALVFHTGVFDALDTNFDSDLKALFEDTAISHADKATIITDAAAKYTVNRATVIAEVETERITAMREKENRKHKATEAKLKALESTDDKSLGKFWDRKMKVWEDRHEVTAVQMDSDDSSGLADMQLNAEFDSQVKKVAGPKPKNGKAASTTPAPPANKQGKNQNPKRGGKQKGKQGGASTKN